MIVCDSKIPDENPSFFLTLGSSMPKIKRNTVNFKGRRGGGAVPGNLNEKNQLVLEIEEAVPWDELFRLNNTK